MIDFGTVTIDGIAESVVRDNVTGIDQDLLTRVVEQMTTPYMSATYAKAKKVWEEVAHVETVPPIADKEAVINWYISRPDYKDADTVEAERVAAEKARKIEKIDDRLFAIDGRIAAVEANIEHESKDPDSTSLEGLQEQLAALQTDRTEAVSEKENIVSTTGE